MHTTTCKKPKTQNLTTKKGLVFSQRVEERQQTLKHLSNYDKNLFLGELICAIDQSQQNGNLCIEEWEDTAELLSIPDLKDRAWAHFNELKKSGKYITTKSGSGRWYRGEV